jgi:hypothetical protein
MGQLSWLSVKWRRTFSVRVDSAPVGAGIFKAWGSIVRWLFALVEQRESTNSRAAKHRLDEPTRLSLSMVASRQCRFCFTWRGYCSCG